MVQIKIFNDYTRNLYYEKNVKLIEKRVNDFCATHNVISVMPSINVSQGMAVIIYTVVYHQNENDKKA